MATQVIFRTPYGSFHKGRTIQHISIGSELYFAETSLAKCKLEHVDVVDFKDDFVSVYKKYIDNEQKLSFPGTELERSGAQFRFEVLMNDEEIKTLKAFMKKGYEKLSDEVARPFLVDLTEAENIKDFLNESRRKIVSVKAIEKMAGVPRNTLLNLLTIGRSIPEHHLENIVNVLVILGYQPTREYNFL